MQQSNFRIVYVYTNLVMSRLVKNGMTTRDNLMLVCMSYMVQGCLSLLFC